MIQSHPRAKTRSSIRKGVSVLLTVCLLFGLWPDTLFAAEGDPAPAPIKYSFLDAFSGSGNLMLVGKTTDPPATSRNSAYGAAISATAIGQARSFQFIVPKSSHYLISFKGYLYFKSGIGAISVDGTRIGTYDFYDPGSRFGPDTALRTVELTEGAHTFTLSVIGRNPKATAGSNYSMYAAGLTLTPMPGPAALQLSAVPSKSLLLLNETAQIQTSVSMSDGTAVTQPVYRFTSDNESVATVSTEGVITSRGKGTATITTTVEAAEGTAVQTSNITVTDQQLAEVYLNWTPDELYVGATARIVLTGRLSDGAPADLSQVATLFASDNPEIVSVNEQGIVAAKQVGETVLRASVTFNGVTVIGVKRVVVTPKTLSSVEVTTLPATIQVSEFAKVSVVGKFEDGSVADLSLAGVTYASNQQTIVAIDPASGMFEGIQPGSAVVSATVELGGVVKSGAAAVTVKALTSDKTRSTSFTPEKVANARLNASRFDWAKSIRDAAVTAAEPFVALGQEFLWDLVPPQTLPRSYGVNQQVGSPVTGKEIDKYGNYPYSADPINEPWKIVDPSSGYKFPTNDFGAYYRSGLDEQGTFRPEKADRSLLVNTLYPEKGPTWGVDDGYGWVDDKGNRFTFIAYYTHWHLWYSSGVIQRAVKALKDAFVYTGDLRYARAGIVLLDRIADVYPSLDAFAYDPNIFLQSAQGTGGGKAVGSVWETSLVKDFISAYDAFYPAMDDPDVLAFLSGKANEHKLSFKRSGTGLRRNAEDGILRQVFPGVKNAQIRGNVGMHQSALAMAAVVLDTFPETKEWLDFNNQAGKLEPNPWRVTGGNMLASLVNDVDRDGHGNEAAPGYNGLWLNNYLIVADVLYGYDKYPQADLYQNVKLSKMFDAKYPLMLSERYMPSIGDSDSTGNPGISVDKAQMIKAFDIYREPIFAQMAHFLNNNSSDGIHADIFAADPEQVATDIEAVVQQEGPLDLDSVNLTGYGFAALRDGENDKRKYGVGYGFPSLQVTEASTSYNTYDATSTVQMEATTPGHTIAFAYEVPKIDTYQVRLKPFRATSYGIYQVFLDGRLVKEIDFFGASKDFEVLAELELTAGSHIISFVNKGKNDVASNYKLGVTELLLLNREEIAKVDAQRNTLRDVWMYYGRNSGHGHRDTLNLGLHAFGLDLAPDLGYPEFADAVDMHRAQWVNNTVSHNTVVVDKRKQSPQWVGTPMHYDDGDRVQLVDVEAPRVYPQLEAYRRTTATIRVDDEHSYSVDFFRVKGGTDHHFSFHAAEGTVTTEGLSLTAQPTGTYAGPNVEFGQRADDVEGPNYMGSGFHWLKNVERDESPSAAFSIDWNLKDTWNVYGKGARADTDVHLRLTMLGLVDDIALADGIPPRNKPGNPPALRYMMAHRTGANLDSLFTSVLEPYKADRVVRAISPAAVKRNGDVVDTNSDNTVRAIKVELADGRTDYIIQSSNPAVSYTIEDKITFQGFFGVYTELEGQMTYGYVQDGGKIGKLGGATVTTPATPEGTVTGFTRSLSAANTIEVQLNAAVAPDLLAGRTIYVAHDGVRNAAYDIRSATSLGGGRYVLDIGDATLIRNYVNSNDFSKGFIYDISEGASFRIPLSAEMNLPVTQASVAGASYNGWYSPDATVTLNVYSDKSQVLRTEYSLDGGASWSTYAQPIKLTADGIHTMQYRSVHKQQTAEETKSVTVQIDGTAPGYTLSANGAAVTNGTVLNDGQPVTFVLSVQDPLSGVAGKKFSVSDAVYGSISDPATITVDWAGQLGPHTVTVEVYDAAGNVAAHTYTIRVSTSLEAMEGLVERYAADGGLIAPLLTQLRNSLMQVRHHLDKGSLKQASTHMDHFRKHLNNPEMRQYRSEQVSVVLNADAEALIALWDAGK